jgi:hypothetical protein
MSRSRKRKKTKKMQVATPKAPNKAATPRRGQSTPQHVRVWRAGKWLITTALAPLGAISAIYAIWGPVWPTEPEIHPHDVTDGGYSCFHSQYGTQARFSIWTTSSSHAALILYILKTRKAKRED